MWQIWIWDGYFIRFAEKCHTCDKYDKPQRGDKCYRSKKYQINDKIKKCDKHEKF